MAFSGVTSVKFTAAPGRIKRTEKKERHKEEKRKDETEKGERMRQSIVKGIFSQIIAGRYRSLYLMSVASL